MNYIEVNNNQRIHLSTIPILEYDNFADVIVNFLKSDIKYHCVNYFGYLEKENIKLICCIADDSKHSINVLSSIVKSSDKLQSITPNHYAMHIFEREIHENFGIDFIEHPWLKPVRYSFNRADKNSNIANYPFYKIDSEELHEVGVGPIHAGVIEPGHFRFICNGEQILHLEIQLGYQHRGIEQLILEKKNLLQRTTIVENIAGDTVVGHTVAFAQAMESLCGFLPSEALQFERVLALEHERIAIHTGDLSAICTDVAYQLGSSVFGRLRTPVINYFQQWCGNRLAKGLIRVGKTNFQFSDNLAEKWLEVFNAYKPDFQEMCDEIFDLPSILARLEKTGTVSTETATKIGTVGMSARASNLNRDIRFSHPSGYYNKLNYMPILGKSGDVHARAKLRKDEINTSIELITKMLAKYPKHNSNEPVIGVPVADSFVISFVEGWRGEICHCAITDDKGELKMYKIKDPSLHNWLALALSVRNNEISDFPICNKSFNLSYCGHDL